MTIPLNIPFYSGYENQYINQAIEAGTFAGDGRFTKMCETYLEDLTGSPKVLLTSSCTHALEMAAILLEIKEGDEIIMSSFNFVSAANAFVLRGGKVVFVDIDPLNCNIDPTKLESAINKHTKAILVMHYGGVAADMEHIVHIARKHRLAIVEDAAHCIGAHFKGKHLGTIGDFGAISFHASKNIHCGEGGALLINNPKYIERAWNLREKGTNKKQFLNGLVEKYSWVDIGSSYLMNELTAAFLYGQLLEISAVNNRRKEIWNFYRDHLSKFRPVTSEAEHNAHIFYFLCQSLKERMDLQNYLESKGIQAAHHYVPLHSSSAGRKYTTFIGQDEHTTTISQRLLRLPIYFSLSSEGVVANAISNFYDV